MQKQKRPCRGVFAEGYEQTDWGQRISDKQQYTYWIGKTAPLRRGYPKAYPMIKFLQEIVIGLLLEGLFFCWHLKCSDLPNPQPFTFKGLRIFLSATTVLPILYYRSALFIMQYIPLKNQKIAHDFAHENEPGTGTPSVPMHNESPDIGIPISGLPSAQRLPVSLLLFSGIWYWNIPLLFRISFPYLISISLFSQEFYCIFLQFVIWYLTKVGTKLNGTLNDDDGNGDRGAGCDIGLAFPIVERLQHRGETICIIRKPSCLSRICF